MYNLIPLLFCGFGLLATNTAVADLIDGEELVDPTRPFFFNRNANEDSMLDLFRSVVPASFDVTFVRASSTSPIAVVNEQRVTIGDVIGGALVVAIDRNGVTLLVNDQERRVNLYGASIKGPATGR